MPHIPVSPSTSTSLPPPPPSSQSQPTPGRQMHLRRTSRQSSRSRSRSTSKARSPSLQPSTSPGATGSSFSSSYLASSPYPALPSSSSSSVVPRVRTASFSTSKSKKATLRSKSSATPASIGLKTKGSFVVKSGVYDVTLKVIKHLEGLGLPVGLGVGGHLVELVQRDASRDSPESDIVPEELEKLEEELEEVEVETVLTRGAVPRKPKTDLEIPRKLLHSSIGFFTLYLYTSKSSVQTVVLVLWTALLIIIPADLLRFRYPRFATTYEKYFGFLMRESERNTINGVVWYILGVNFVLSFYPADVATVSILILSWADTAASTIGRLYGSYTPKLPSSIPLLPSILFRFLPSIPSLPRLPILRHVFQEPPSSSSNPSTFQTLRTHGLRLPFAPRKSLAGFMAACLTGALVAFGFWGWVAPLPLRTVGDTLGLLTLSAFAGLVSGVAEALDLGSLDDNLTLPIISGGCILAFLKVAGLGAAAVAWK